MIAGPRRSFCIFFASFRRYNDTGFHKLIGDLYGLVQKAAGIVSHIEKKSLERPFFFVYFAKGGLQFVCGILLEG